MKFNYIIIFLFLVFPITAFSQSSLYRSYVPQNPTPQNFQYVTADIQTPVQTSDKGFILGFHPWAPNIHWAFPEDFYIIKTDSNLIPQWKFPYFCRSVPLPTGGIILFWSYGYFGLHGYQNTFLQKVTSSGVTVWSRMISGDTQINSGVQYGNRVRFVGSQITLTSVTVTPVGTSDGLSFEIDTMGNLINSTLVSDGSILEFRNVTRTNSGDFFVTTTNGKTVLAKFTSSFTPIWSMEVALGARTLRLKKIEELGNGDLIATGQASFDLNYSSPVTACVIRFNNLGNLQTLKYFDEHYIISELCKTPLGSFVGTFGRRFTDSLQIFSVDSLLSISNLKHLKSGFSIGTPAKSKGGLIIPLFDNDPKIISTNYNGSNCYTTPGLCPIFPGNTQLINNILTVTTGSISLSNHNPNQSLIQGYTDSCRCSAVTSGAIYTVCTGNPLIMQANSFNPVNWYTSPFGGNAVYTGTTYTFVTNNGPTAYMYTSDAICPNNQRAQMLVNVSASPQIQIASSQTLMCLGDAVTLTITSTSSASWQPYSVSSTTTLFPSGNSQFFFSGTGPSGCTSIGSINLQTQVCLSLEEDANIEIAVFPNPVSNELHIRTGFENCKIIVQNVFGQVIIDEIFQNEIILNTNACAPGIYTYDIIKNNTCIKKGKMTKQ